MTGIKPRPRSYDGVSGGVAFMETCAIVRGGRRIGTLRMEQKGLMTAFDAAVPASEELLRLSVYGGGAEGYLGVMQPEGGGLGLHRLLSRAAMAGFPAEIEYAGPAGERQDAQPQPASGAAAAAEAAPAPEEDLLWFSAPDGTLSAFDGRRMLLALPSAGAALPRGAEGVRRVINGREYVVFPR